MGQISWDLQDPVVDKVSFSKDTTGFWNVTVALQELTPGSLKDKVIKVKLIDETKTHGTKDVAQTLWPVAGSRQAGKASSTVLTFNTAATARPDRMKLEIEIP